MNDPSSDSALKAEWRKVFRHATLDNINARFHCLEFIKYEGSEDIKMIVHRTDGGIESCAPWSLRQAEQLVESGNWKVEVFDIGDHDVPDAKYGVEVW